MGNKGIYVYWKRKWKLVHYNKVYSGGVVGNTGITPKSPRKRFFGNMFYLNHPFMLILWPALLKTDLKSSSGPHECSGKPYAGQACGLQFGSELLMSTVMKSISNHSIRAPEKDP